jgi:hypothetical protein
MFSSSTFKYHSKFLEYMLFTDPVHLIAMPEQSDDDKQVGHTIHHMFKTGVLNRMWIDRTSHEVMVA